MLQEWHHFGFLLSIYNVHRKNTDTFPTKILRKNFLVSTGKCAMKKML